MSLKQLRKAKPKYEDITETKIKALGVSGFLS
jgi:hypothetical protein